jgi:hypothetical protein
VVWFVLTLTLLKDATTALPIDSNNNSGAEHSSSFQNGFSEATLLLLLLLLLLTSESDPLAVAAKNLRCPCAVGDPVDRIIHSRWFLFVQIGGTNTSLS